MKRQLSYALGSLALLGGTACQDECRKGAEAAPSGVPITKAVDSTAAIALQKVTFAEFEKAIADQHGKVVVVDVWGNFCPPCKKKFPHLVQIHQAFANRGVVTMSLSLDEEENEAGVRDFLTCQEAHFPNLMLVDSEENKILGNRRIEVNVPPLLHVFDRNGSLVKTFDRGNSDKEVEDFIGHLLEKK